jgi:hypothetical protein
MSNLVDIFKTTSQQETRPYFGDTMVFYILHQMANWDHPLIKITGPALLPLWNSSVDINSWTISLTSTGQDILDQKMDLFHVNLIDKWLGGVHLSSETKIWRWNQDLKKIC